MREPLSKLPGAALHWTDQSDFPLDWNGPTHRPFDPFAPESKACPIVDLLERVVRRFPQRIALSGPEAPVTYAEFWRAVNGCAEQIAATTTIMGARNAFWRSRCKVSSSVSGCARRK